MRSFLLPIFLLGCLSFPGFTHLGFAQNTPAQGSSKSAPQLDHFDPKKVDASVDPCTDFYQYSCNRWIADNPVPADEVFWGSFGKLQLWNETFVHQTVLEVAAKPAAERTAVEQKVGDYWSACTDEKQRNATALDTLRPQLQRIEAMRSKSEIADVVADLHRSVPGAWNPADPATFAALFGFGAQPDFHDTTHVIAQFDQGGMALPGREFYLNDDAKSVEIRTKYVAHIARMFELSGVPSAQAKMDAAVVLQMETAMAKAAMDIVKRRDPKNLDNEMNLDAVKKLAPSFNWSRYLQLVHAPAATTFIVTSPDFFRGTEQLIQSEPLEHWKAYLKWQLLNGLAGSLNEDFENQDFTFVAQTLFGAKEIQPLWRRCIQAEDRDIGQALGQAYVARAFSPESKERVQQMVNALKAALGQEVDSMGWMSPQTKKQAHLKLAAQIDKIGYPDHWRDYSALEIHPDNHLANVERAATFELDRQLQKIGKRLDRTEWGMTPPTVNAYEDAQTNTINFPAGILQPPFFDPTKDDSVNYAAAGAVIGHETIHGYDDQGRKFDENGNLRDWWTADDAKAYDKRGDCIADEYTEFVPEAGVQQNGRLTQGENTADNGGIHLALSALDIDLKGKGQSLDAKGEDGLTALQRFFLSYSNIWCSNIRPELMRTVLLSNPHPLDKYRVNNVVSNMPEFAKAFGCHKGQAMVRENACRVW
ncbi:MAG TPA: M13 family metallopeptidase [Terriglobales bacterium]|nr:M13 family metallopeptidase [Terriglobales bacterium]